MGVSLFIAAATFVWLCLINLLTLVAFDLDKKAAQNGDWRIPESQLLLMAFVGGTPAAFVARHALRHKTRKQPFGFQLYAIAGLQILVGCITLYRTAA